MVQKNDDLSGRDNFGPGGHPRTLLFLSRLSPLLRLVSPTLCMLVSQEGNLTNYPHPCRAFQHVCLKPGGIRKRWSRMPCTSIWSASKKIGRAEFASCVMSRFFIEQVLPKNRACPADWRPQNVETTPGPICRPSLTSGCDSFVEPAVEASARIMPSFVEGLCYDVEPLLLHFSHGQISSYLRDGHGHVDMAIKNLLSEQVFPSAFPPLASLLQD